ncbi:hypothetical protein C5F59_027715 [Streptomyces sp. QL37]|uniref:hypothetical protein n=1 Tax=Streptomyces sp. QL37 TaxID=2093747 RepID=UPI000CF23D7D|nr:hypothetical protein [Streptomyces sp. QL37]PPQ57103.1 hypothetical protein C5F59_10730 [Streptomyces sp. QL37]
MKIFRAMRFFRFLTTARPRLLGGAYSGPTRVNVSSIPGGAVLHLDHHLVRVVLELAEQFTEDPDGVGDQLREIDALSNPAKDSHAEHERDQLVDELLEQVGGTHLRLHGDQVRRVAELLLSSNGAGTVIAMPRQRQAGAA